MSTDKANGAAGSCIRIFDPVSARAGILKRGHFEDSALPAHVQTRVDEMFGGPTTALAAVQKILLSVRERGDVAVADWSRRIDGVDLTSGAEVQQTALDTARDRVNPTVIEGLRVSRDRIVAYHRKQPVTSWFTSDLGGITGQAVVPIERVGVYVPGGTAPLPSTVLMSALPAVVAGSSEIVIVSPPRRETGAIADVTLAACAVINELPGVRVRVFSVGGAQAIGALAYGTLTIPRVDKIVGPGNIFVTIAKKEVFGIVGIDGVYGPTEAVVVADDSADPRLVAADLLAQAEHDFMAVPILITASSDLANNVIIEVDTQLSKLSRADVARHALLNQGGIVLASTLDECLELASDFATEHVSLSIKSPWDAVSKIKNAGGIFLGEGSCEVLGDYVAGPSHVMPTGGSARFSSPLSVLDFIKVISVVGLDPETVRSVAPHAERVARAEGLDGHANAAAMRKNFALPPQ
jgi:histidinol dehydrogenase